MEFYLIGLIFATLTAGIFLAAPWKYKLEDCAECFGQECEIYHMCIETE